jgi:hypothetical protein
MERTAAPTEEPLIVAGTPVPAGRLDEIFADADYVVAYAGYRVKADVALTGGVAPAAAASLSS